MFTYEVYGLGLHSALPLPELIPGGAGEADVVFRFSNISHPRLPPSATVFDYWMDHEGVYLHWSEVGTFLVREGREVIIDPVQKVEESRLRLFLLGAALGVLLHQRGILVLHASAIAIRGAGVAFLGEKRQGKSTMAGYFHARGAQLIADDLVAVKTRGGDHLVLPAFPQLKLWPDALTHLGKDPEAMPRFSSNFEKRDCRISDGFSAQPVSFERAYVLENGADVSFELVEPHRAMIYFAGYSYVARFGQQILQSGGSLHFSQCAELAQSIPVYRLIRPPSLRLLNDIAEMIEEHQRTVVSEASENITQGSLPLNLSSEEPLLSLSEYGQVQ